jgi:hypothetical protein
VQVCIKVLTDVAAKLKPEDKKDIVKVRASARRSP